MKDSYDNHKMNLNKDLPLNEEMKNVDKKEMRKTRMNHYEENQTHLMNSYMFQKMDNNLNIQDADQKKKNHYYLFLDELNN